MVFTTMHVLEQAALLDGLARTPGLGCQQLLLGFKVDETRALDAAWHATEAQFTNFFGQADGFEQLRTTVRSDGRYAHFREDLEQTFGDAFAVVLEHLIEVAQYFTGADQVAQHFVGQERIDRRGTEADQHRKVMRVTGSRGFDQDVAVATQAFFGQAVMHGAHSQRGVNRQLARRDMTVAQNDLGATGARCFFGLIGDIAHSRFKTDAFVVVEVNDLTLKARQVEVHQRAPFCRRDHGRTENHTGSVLRGFLEDVALGTEADFQRHDDGFTQRVDRRVGDLRKLLAEVIVRCSHTLGQHGHWRVIAHRTYGFVALLAQRTQHLVALFERDLIHLHVLLELIDVVKRRTVVVVFHGRLNAQGILAQPLLVRVARLQAVVDGVGVQHLTGFGVHRQDLAGANTAFGYDVLRLVVPHADFGGDGDVAVGGGHPTRRAQAVTVE